MGQNFFAQILPVFEQFLPERISIGLLSESVCKDPSAILRSLLTSWQYWACCTDFSLHPRAVSAAGVCDRIWPSVTAGPSLKGEELLGTVRMPLAKWGRHSLAELGNPEGMQRWKASTVKVGAGRGYEGEITCVQGWIQDGQSLAGAETAESWAGQQGGSLQVPRQQNQGVGKYELAAEWGIGLYQKSMEKARVLNAFFASVFTEEVCSQSQCQLEWTGTTRQRRINLWCAWVSQGTGQSIPKCAGQYCHEASLYHLQKAVLTCMAPMTRKRQKLLPS